MRKLKRLQIQMHFLNISLSNLLLHRKQLLNLISTYFQLQSFKLNSTLSKHITDGHLELLVFFTVVMKELSLNQIRQ